MNVQLLGVTTIAKALGIGCQVAKDDAYGQLPERSGRGSYACPTSTSRPPPQQLSKVGVRLSPATSE